jgi:hypothetical protein
VPLGEHHRIGHRRATREDGAGRFDVGAGIQQGVEHGDIVAARRRMQRRFSVACRRGVMHGGVDVGPRGHEQRHRLRAVGKMPGPIGDDMEQCSLNASSIDDPRSGQLRIGVQLLFQRVEVTAADRGDDGDRSTIVCG